MDYDSCMAKARSSSQRKELFRSIQDRKGVAQLVTTIDRYDGSMELNIHYVESCGDPKEGEQYFLRVGFCDCTYTVLILSQFVDEFVYELGVRTDSIED